ncbi:uncharacterized protein LOC116766009 isoform X1 [Danaus plexippus]|uniref:uncharacterized protein LOC116766009 isoform X1 n=1 Tax=Danaus plexippus TaxID=13037 RepID=UPI002AB1111A|nr:uncharacterized protein LOC116766009 isoform X1 [Danaus plexippus]
MLSTISEKGTLTPVRINSPRRAPIINRNYVTPQYSHRPININTADIDVSRDKYRYKKSNTTPELVSKLPSRNDSPKTNKETGHDKPDIGIDSSPGRKRTTIKRDRPVVRLHTVKRKDKDSPRKPVQTDTNKAFNSGNEAEKLEKQSETLKWRQKLADDLSYRVQKEKKSLGAKLVEKFTLKDKENDDYTLTKKESPTTVVIRDILNKNNVENNETTDKLNRRCSMELLAEQANLLDSLIRRENLSTVTLDLSKIGTEGDAGTKPQINTSKKAKTLKPVNPLTTTKSDHSLHDRLKEKKIIDKKPSKRQSIRKCSSGSSICRLDSITESPKNVKQLEASVIEDQEKNEKPNKVVKPKVKRKITSSVEVTTPPSPLKFIVENVTVEEKSRPLKKDIIYSSTVDEILPQDKPFEINAEETQNIHNTNMETMELNSSNSEIKTNIQSENLVKGHRSSIKSKPILKAKSNLNSPEPEDGNFWDKIGKRETVYLVKRKQNLEDTQEKIKRSLFWFPSEEEEVECSDTNAFGNSSEKKCINNSTLEVKDHIEAKVNLNLNKDIFQGDSSQLSVVQDKSDIKDESTTKNLKAEIENLDKIKDEPKLKQTCTKTNNEGDKSRDLNSEKPKIRNFKVKKNIDDSNIKKINLVNKVDSHIKEAKNESPNTSETHKIQGEEKNIPNTCLAGGNTSSLENESKHDKISVDIVSTQNTDSNILETDKTEDVNKVDDVSKTTIQSMSKEKLNQEGTDKLFAKFELQVKNKNHHEKTKERNDKEQLKIYENQSEIDVDSEINRCHDDNLNKINEPLKGENNIDIHDCLKTNLLKENESQLISGSDLTENVEDTKDKSNVEKVSSVLLSSEEQKSCSSTSNEANIPNIVDEVKNSMEKSIVDNKENNVSNDNKNDIAMEKPTIVPPKKVKEEKSPFVLIATPRPLQKRNPQVIRSSSSSETSEDSSEEDEDEKESDSSEEGTEFFECESNVDGRTSTGSNDSGFDSSAPTSPASFLHVKKDCDVNCHRKCEKLTANLCGVNQRLLVEALATRTTSKKGADSPSTSTSPATSQTYNFDISEQELEHSTAYDLFRKTGRFIPPARSIPRFRKYTIDDFQFIRVLGKGSFGKVMLAELRDTEYYYAVKCLKKDVVLEDDDVECTLIERKVLALGTNHPYLCHLFATFQTDSHLFFVMEYLNGGDLMFHIQQSGRFPEARARLYAAEIVSGLKFLHKRGIVYRDLKLDNILLDFDGHVRIADFGMCKLQIYLDKTADTFCGTPDYMAPEIIKGLKYNQTVDWWSFGVLLYEMLIGQSPFSGCDEDELFWSICNEMPSYPRFLSKEALSILTRLLDKDAKTRLGGTECMYGDVRDQDFFRPINWERLEHRELEAPFKPRVRHPMDTQYFDRAFTGERPRLTTVEPQVLRSMDQEPFRGFSYTNPNATDR